jgi:sulfite exporter TauE/SafE
VSAVLLLSALAMGLAGAPHCLAMCGAACAAITGRRLGARWAAWHAGRLAGYAAGGAIAAGSVGALASLAAAAPVLRPLWTLVHAAAAALGLWLLWHGRQPAWLERIGRRVPAPAAAAGWQPIAGPARAAAAGGLWVAWPCGLLQSALVVAALGNDALAGASIMLAFGLGSALGLVAGQSLWQRLGGGAQGTRWAVRLAGAGLLAASAWALGHGLWQRVAAWCTGQ